MSQQIINLGLIPNDGSGDALRVGAQKINENFTELYERGIPEQAGNNGKFLTTSGTVLRWDRVTDITGNAATVTNGIYTTGSYNNPSWIASLSPSKVLPTQSGNNGKYLTTDGSTLAWVDLEAVSIFDYNNLINRPVFPDNTSDLVNDSGFITSSALTGYATETYVNSRGFITSNGLPSQASNAGKYLTTNGTTLSWATVTSGTTDYNNLTNKPTIPTSFNSLVNGVHTLSLGSTGNTTFPTGLTLGAPRGVGTVNFTAAVDKEFQIETGTATSGKLWQFGTDGSLTIPGDIKSQGNINIDINLADSTLRRWQFGEDGSLMTPNDLQIYKGAGSVNYIESTIIGGLNIVSKGLAQFKTTWDPQGVVPTGYTQPLSRRTTTSADLFGYNIGVVAPNFANWNWRFTPDGNLEIPGDIKSNNNINIEINPGDSTLRRWQFGEDGKLTFPDGANYAGQTVTMPTTNGNTTNSFVWEFSDNSIGSDRITLNWNLLASDTAGFYIGTTHSTTGKYLFLDGTDQSLSYIAGGGLFGGGKLIFGSSAGNNAGDANAIEIKATNGDVYLTSTESVKITVDASDSSARIWTFDPTGSLTLPSGGNISEGSIPGGALTGNTIVLTPNGGTSATQQLLVYPTTGPDANHLHLTSGDLTTTELFLGNDDQYVKLASDGNVSIQADDGLFTAAAWTFGFDGSLTIPGDIKSNGNINIDINLADSTLRRWQFGEDGDLTFPNGVLKIAGNTISNYVAGDMGGSGSQLEVSQSKTVITNGVTNNLGGNPSLTGQSLFEVSTNGILSSFQVINTLGEGEPSLTGEYLTELDNLNFKIGQRITNDLGDGSEPLVAFNGWTFSTDAPGLTKTLTFPDDTVQSTAWTGVVGTQATLNVTGAATAERFKTDQITVVGNRISTTVTNANLELECNGTGGVVVNGGKLILNTGGNAYVESVDYGVNSANSALNIFGGPYQKIKLRAGFGTQATWTLGTDGSLTFPNATVQTTAYTGVPSLSTLTGVAITSPSTGQVLKYNGTNWINDADATAGGAGAGTVTTVSVTSANGFTGTVATASSTPAITITTSITGVLKGNGTAISAAVAGTDYQAPIGTISGLVKGNGANALTAATSGTDYAPGTSALATGIVKSTTTTGVLSIAVAGTDYQAPITRTTANATTASLANAATGNLTITGFKGYVLYKIQTSAAAWVRIYTDVASRTADAGRSELTDPLPGAGVIAEVITTGAETILISPGSMGFSNESTPSTNIQLAVTNKSGGVAAITVTLTVLQLEA